MLILTIEINKLEKIDKMQGFVDHDQFVPTCSIGACISAHVLLNL